MQTLNHVGRKLSGTLAVLMLAACAAPAAPTAAPKAAPAQPTVAPAQPTAVPPTAPPAPTSVPATAAPTAVPPTATAKPKPVIKLAENPWAGSAANVHVAKVIIEKQLGNKVEIVTIDENAQWAALSNNELSASLEVWPSGHAENEDKFVTKAKTVEKLGELGVVGKISWYVPSYMVKENPELATWEGIKKNAALFKTAETGSRGRFLQGDASWVYFDEPIIKNLAMNLSIKSAGSEQAVLAALDAAYAKKSPILFYFWTPHSAHAKYELTPVKLPESNEACEKNKAEKALNAKVNCDYLPDPLFKVASVKLKTEAPDVHTFLKNFNYDAKTQIELMAAIEGGKKPEVAAAEWVAKNEAVWKAWLPK